MRNLSEREMIRLDTLIELKLFNSSFSSSNFSIRVFRALLLVPRRAFRGKSSDSRQYYLSQQYPPPLLIFCPVPNIVVVVVVVVVVVLLLLLLLLKHTDHIIILLIIFIVLVSFQKKTTTNSNHDNDNKAPCVRRGPLDRRLGATAQRRSDFRRRA